MQLALRPQITDEQESMQTPECVSQEVSLGQSQSEVHFDEPMQPSL